jgi:hypothetical protein
MMRLGRRASLLVALSLLASAATASAECAWVLWVKRVSRSSRIETWEPVAGASTQTGCDQDTRPERLPAHDTNAATAVRLLCLPDTVDPRGPKGK